MDSVTLGQISELLTWLAGIITSGTVIYKLISNYSSKKLDQAIRASMESVIKPLQDELAEVKNELHTVRAELEDNNIQTARLDLNTAIEHTPHEHETILKLAEHYFLVLGGDAWMSGKFRKWAKDEGVDISYIVEQVPHLKW